MPAFVGHEGFWSSATRIRLLGFGLTLLLLAGACLVGWITLSRLKRDWPARYGVTGAAVGAWCLPYFLLWSPLLLAWARWTERTARYGFARIEVQPSWAVSMGYLLVALLFLLVGLGGFTLLVVLYRSRFLRKVRSA